MAWKALKEKTSYVAKDIADEAALKEFFSDAIYPVAVSKYVEQNAYVELKDMQKDAQK